MTDASSPLRPPPEDPLQPSPESPLQPSPEDRSYVTRPTRFTVFLRTFVPWQAWRFVRINLKMIQMIRRRH